MAAQRARWATEHNVAVAQSLVPAKRPNPLVKPKPNPRDMEIRWRVRELNRQAQVPYWWTAGTATAGTVGWGFTALMDWTVSSTAATTTGLVIGGVAAGVHGVTRLVKRKTLARWRRRYLAASAMSTGWITTASLAGLSWWQLAVLGVSGVALGAGYRRQLRCDKQALLTPPPEPILPAPEPEDAVLEPAEPDIAAEYIHRWNAHIGNGNGVLAGSHLTGMRVTERGVEGIVNLAPGKHTLETALGAVPQVRSGLYLSADDGDDEPGEEVLFDQPGRVNGARLSANQVRIQIITRSPVRTSQFFERPLYAQDNPGTALIGQYADGEGYAPWQIYNHDGVWSGVIIAGTGGGKSSVMDVLAVSTRGTGVMNIGFIDPQGGASSPTLKNNASLVALGQQQILPALEALEAIANNREHYLNAHDNPALVPGAPVNCAPGCPCGGIAPPGLLVFIDECDQVFGATDPKTNKTLGDRFGELAKRIRKLGVGFVCASQYSGLKVFGNSELLRSNLAARNIAAFHTASNTSGGLIPGLPVDPKTLPKRPGYGVIASVGARTAPMRAFWAPRRNKDEHVNPPAFVDDVIVRYPEPPMHPIDRKALAGRLDSPEEAAQRAKTRSLQALAALMNDHPVPAETAPSGGVGARAPRQRGGLFAVPSPVVTPKPTQLLSLSALSEVERAVVEAMRDGRTRTGEIVESYGVDNAATRGKVHRSLRSLTAKGWVVDAGHGHWQLTDPAKAAFRATAA